jgi:hypothetical protein
MRMPTTASSMPAMSRRRPTVNWRGRRPAEVRQTVPSSQVPVYRICTVSPTRACFRVLHMVQATQKSTEFSSRAAAHGQPRVAARNAAALPQDINCMARRNDGAAERRWRATRSQLSAVEASRRHHFKSIRIQPLYRHLAQTANRYSSHGSSKGTRFALAGIIAPTRASRATHAPLTR